MGKLRTRQHLIEDLSYNFVQRCVLKAFCVFQTYPTRQYSYDAQILTFNDRGEAEKGLLYIQVKATDRLQFSEKHDGYLLDLDKRDLELWIG